MLENFNEIYDKELEKLRLSDGIWKPKSEILDSNFIRRFVFEMCEVICTKCIKEGGQKKWKQILKEVTMEGHK